jgi:hypothetical protein
MAWGLLEDRTVKTSSDSRATLSHRLFGRVIAIAALAGCGGVMASPDAGPGCPSAADIQTQAAVGRACAEEGEFCPQPGCDPCSQNCKAVSCSNGVWEPAVNTGLCVDSGQCIEVDPTSFDQSCNLDSDCMAITAGTFCSGQSLCTCPIAAIDVDGQSQYQADIQAVQSLGEPQGCACPFIGSPRCIQNVCTLCGPQQCPDGG